MKLFLNEGNIYKVNNEVKLEFINLEDFYSKMLNVPKPIPNDYLCSFVYKVIVNENEFKGQYDIWPNIKRVNNLDEKCQYDFKFIGISYTRDDANKYIEFDLLKK